MFLKLLQGLNSNLEAKIRLDYDVCVCVCALCKDNKDEKNQRTIHKKNISTKWTKSIHLENERREFHLIYTESNLRMLNQTWISMGSVFI